MSDELRARRRALLEELGQVEQALAGNASAATPSGSDEAWRALVAQASEFLILVDSELRLCFVNHTQPGIGDVTGMLATDFIPEQYWPRMRDAVRSARVNGRPEHYEIPGTGPNGETSWYSTWAVPLPAGLQGPGLQGASVALVTSDVSHQRRVEAALEDERSVLASLVDHAPDYIMVLDRAHTVRFMNRIPPGLTRELVIGADAGLFLAEEQRAGARAAIESVFETGESTSYEAMVLVPGGPLWASTRIGPILRGGKVERVSLVARDVTAQRLLESEREKERESLSASEARFRTLVDYAPEAVVILDVELGHFVDANQKACEFFELSREEICRCGPLELSAPTTPDGQSSAELGTESINRALAGSQPVFEWTHRTGGGRDIPSEVRLVRLPHPERQLIRGSLIDISERLRAEAERGRLSDELFQARKLQAVGQLTGGVAHDFNNLLTVIMAHAELLQARSGGAPAVLQHATQVLDAAKRAAVLTQQLLAFARRQPLRPRVVDLRVIVGGMEQLLRRTLGETIDVRTEIPASLWACEVDPAQLESALLNLALNARDAMPQGGVLTIALENVERPSAARVAKVSGAGGPQVALRVRDTGTGMDPDVMAHAFEPFFTTKDVGSGSGLGLSMVYGFVTQSGGEVDLRSEPGRGTEITIYLPRSAAPGRSEPESEGNQDAAPGAGQLILVVEDDPQVRELTVDKLTALGYRTLDAGDAAEAVRLLAATPDVALILSDVVLPGGTSGPDLARRLAESHPALPVIFMSGYPADALTEDGRVGPTVTLLQKPFTQAQLAHVVSASVSPGRDA